MAMPQHPEARPEREREVAPTPLLAGVMGGFTLASFIGLGAVVLAIIGLAGGLPFYMAAVGMIVVGASMLFAASAFTASAAAVLPVSAERRPLLSLAVPTGAGAWVLGGVAALVLSILSLFFTGSIAWVAAGGVGAALGLLLGGGWARTRLPGLGAPHTRAAWFPGDYGRGADLWAGIVALVTALLAAPIVGGLLTGTLTGRAAAVGTTASLSLVLVSVLVLGASLFVSGMQRAWAYRSVQAQL